MPNPLLLKLSTTFVGLGALRGWRRFLVAFLAGLASVLALAPFFISPILFLTLPLLVWQIDAACHDTNTNSAATDAASSGHSGPSGPSIWRTAYRAALIGWWFAFGYFAGGLFWIGEAFLVEADTFAWLLPFAVTLMPAGLALFWAGAIGVAALLWRPGSTRILALAVSLSGFEWLRGHILTGFPWNVPGYALSYPLVLMQSAGVVGIYGLTLIALLMFTAPLVIWQDNNQAHDHTNVEGRRDKRPRARLATAKALAIAIIPFVIMTLYGWQRLSIPIVAPDPDITIRIVQPSVPQTEKWRPEHQARIFNQHLAMSRRNAAGKLDNLRNTTLLIWPEAAMPFLPLRDDAVLRRLATLLPDNTRLLSGALRMEEAVAELPWSRRRVFNTAMMFGSKGELLAKYDKTHLVPFGEYLPYQDWLEALGLRQLTGLPGGFDVGISPRPLISLPGLPKIGTLICYEVIFPGVGAMAAARPDVLINLTNDGWFGNTTGPRQHMHQARVRAVEEGLPLIRAANNGISALVDPYGRMLHKLDIDVRGVIDAKLPKSIAPPPYARLGDKVFAIMWLICLTFLTSGLYCFGLLKTPSLRT